MSNDGATFMIMLFSELLQNLNEMLGNREKGEERLIRKFFLGWRANIAYQRVNSAPACARGNTQCPVT